MASSRRVGFLINHLGAGGAERVISRLTSLLGREAELELFLILFDGKVIAYPYEATLLDMALPAQQRIVRKFINMLARIASLRRIKRKCNLDVTISFLDSPNIINAITTGRRKTVLSVRNYKTMERRSSGWIGSWKARLISLLYNRADHVVVVSQVIRKEMIESFSLKPEKVVTIYNPYNVDEIVEKAAEPLDLAAEAFFAGHRVIGSLGRLTYQKGFWHLLKAFALLRQADSSLGLCIIGEGEHLGKLKQQAEELHISEHVLFCGYQSNPFRWMAKCECFVLTSLFEGFPNGLVEAMACGIPVVAVDCKSGPREILYREPQIDLTAKGIELADFGILVPPLGDSEMYGVELEPGERTLAQAVEMILRNPEKQKQYGKLSRQRANEFNYPKIAEQWLELIWQ